MGAIRDQWAAGSTYEEFMGRWSRRLAPEFVVWLGVPAGAHWLDVGCGTGALADAICAEADPATVVGCDPAPAFVDFARRHSGDPRESFVVAGVDHLPGRSGGYGSVASLFGLNFFPDAAAGLAGMLAVAASGATISACVWDYGEGMEFLRRFWDAAVALDSAASALDEATRFPICRPDSLESLFRDGGLTDVRCLPIQIPTVFPTFDDYWRPFLGGTGPAPSYVASLDEDDRVALGRTIEASLPRDADRGIPLRARAWAVRGTVAE